jgi:catechol 2,3-dioxygenase-like lactoylglutathione lyase family enzyme
MPKLEGVLETALYVNDLPRAIEFYKSVFEFETLFADERLCAFNVSNRQVLLLFLKGASDQAMTVSGGTIPPHDGDGHLHLAFAIAEDELEKWEKQFAEKEIHIESRVRWPRGGVSLYIRDPEGHLIELATPGLWKIY